MSDFKTLDDVSFQGKRVLLRVDLNVPMDEGKVTDKTRIERVAGTIREIAGKGGRVVLLAHFGTSQGQEGRERESRTRRGGRGRDPRSQGLLRR